MATENKKTTAKVEATQEPAKESFVKKVLGKPINFVKNHKQGIKTAAIGFGAGVLGGGAYLFFMDKLSGDEYGGAEYPTDEVPFEETDAPSDEA